MLSFLHSPLRHRQRQRPVPRRLPLSLQGVVQDVELLQRTLVLEVRETVLPSLFFFSKMGMKVWLVLLDLQVVSKTGEEEEKSFFTTALLPYKRKTRPQSSIAPHTRAYVLRTCRWSFRSM